MKNLFKVGDRVQVRDWDDMEKEHGLNGGSGSSICVPFSFTQEMEHLCGLKAIIYSVDNSNTMTSTIKYLLHFEHGEEYYSFSAEMLISLEATELSNKFKKEQEKKFDEALI